MATSRLIFFVGWIYAPWVAAAACNLIALRLLFIDQFSEHSHRNYCHPSEAKRHRSIARGIEEQNQKTTNLYLACNRHLAPLPSTME